MRRLVVLRALGLGDLLTAVPALRGLAAAFPGHRILLAAPAPLAPLARLSGSVDGFVPAEPLAPLPAALHGPDVAVNLHGRGPASHRRLLEARPRRLLAFAHPEIPETAGAPRWRPGEHEVERWCRLLRESGVPADPGALLLPLPPPLPGLEDVVVVHPGAASPARRWPPERFAALARRAAERGLRVALTGSRAERGLAVEVAARAGLEEDAVLAGRTGLGELAALVAHARCAVSGDTGVAHLAAAFATPSVALYGPTSPREWGPPAAGPHEVLWAGLRGDPHGAETHAGLLAIGVEEAVAALDRALSRERPTRAAGPGRPARPAGGTGRGAPAAAAPR